MTLTVLSDDQVNSIFESLTLEELEEFRHILATGLHEFSTGSQVDGADAFQQPHRITTLHPETKATTLYMPSCGPGGMGCKVVSLTTSAAMQDPSVKPISPTGVVNLFSPDGELTGVVHASSLTAFRTALSSACLLSRRNHVRDITVFGSGSQAYWHVRLALMMRGSTIRHIYIINHRFSESAGMILKRFSIIPQAVKEQEGWADTKFSILTPSFHEFERLQKEHIRASDVIYCCTPSRQDLFDAHILTNHEGRKKGRLIVAVGSFTPEMRELPEALLHQVTKHDKHGKPHMHFHKHAEEGGVIVVDTLEGVLQEAGEIISAQIPATHLVELGELVMLHRLRVEESEREASTAEAASEFARIDTGDSSSAMSSVYGNPPSRPASPASSTSSNHHKSTFHLPFRSKSVSSSSDHGEKKKEDHMVRWLRDGTVVYKSVGLGLMDLLVGSHLINVAARKNIGSRIEGF